MKASSHKTAAAASGAWHGRRKPVLFLELGSWLSRKLGRSATRAEIVAAQEAASFEALKAAHGAALLAGGLSQAVADEFLRDLAAAEPEVRERLIEALNTRTEAPAAGAPRPAPGPKASQRLPAPTPMPKPKPKEPPTAPAKTEPHGADRARADIDRQVKNLRSSPGKQSAVVAAVNRSFRKAASSSREEDQQKFNDAVRRAQGVTP